MEIEIRKRGRLSDDMQTEANVGKRSAAGAPVEYRLLCPATRIGTIIGKGGSVIQQMRDATGARIKVEPEVAGCNERLISFSSSDEPGLEWCRAQDALFAAQGRLSEADSSQEESCCVVRMLVEHAQVGCVLGKGGDVISDLRRRTGANIRVSDKRDMPACANSEDSLVAVKGDAQAVTEALKLLSALLRTHSQRKPQQARAPMTFNITAVATAAVQPAQAQRRQAMREPVLAPIARLHQCHNCLPDCHAMPPRLPAHEEGGTVVEVQVRLLVPSSHIGCIIGRRGEMIRSIRDDTGAHIKVHEGSQEKKGVDRVITVGAAEAAGAGISPSEEAVCSMALCLLGPSGLPPVPCIRILVPTPQVGVVLGKGGATITQVRKDSGAGVRLIPLDAEDDRWLPRDVAAGQAHKVVHIEGPITATLKALRAVCTHLRAWQARSQGAQPAREGTESYGSAHAPPQQHFQPMLQALLPMRDALRHRGIADLSRAEMGMYDSPLRHCERPVLQNRHSLDLQVMCRGQVDRGAPLLMSQAMTQQAAPLEQGHSRELRLVGVQVGCVLGKAGENISQIRKISGARVKLSDAPRGVTERLLWLSGTCEQVQAAVNLVQAFLLAGRAGSLDVELPMAFN